MKLIIHHAVFFTIHEEDESVSSNHFNNQYANDSCSTCFHYSDRDHQPHVHELDTYYDNPVQNFTTFRYHLFAVQVSLVLWENQRSISGFGVVLSVEITEGVITLVNYPTTTIQNIVASVTTGQNLDLEEIAANLSNVEFDPEQFPGLVYRLKKPKTATLIFNNGKMVCTGGKSEKASRKAIKKIVKNLNHAGIKIVSKPEIIIQNIVASGDLGYLINLEQASMTLENCLYEPEQFPGLIYRMKNPKTVILIFGSGKIVITGAKFEDQIPEVAKKVIERLSELDLLNNTRDESDLLAHD